MVFIIYDSDADGVVSASIALRAVGDAELFPVGTRRIEDVILSARPYSTIYVLDHATFIDLTPRVRAKLRSVRLIVIDHHLSNPLRSVADVAVILQSPSTAEIARSYFGIRDRVVDKLVTYASYSDSYRCHLLPYPANTECWKLHIVANAVRERLNDVVRELAQGRLGILDELFPEAARRAAEAVATLRRLVRSPCPGVGYAYLDGKRLVKALVPSLANSYDVLVIETKNAVRVLGGNSARVREASRLIYREIGARHYGRSAKVIVKRSPKLRVDPATLCRGRAL